MAVREETAEAEPKPVDIVWVYSPDLDKIGQAESVHPDVARLAVSEGRAVSPEEWKAQQREQKEAETAARKAERAGEPSPLPGVVVGTGEGPTL